MLFLLLLPSPLLVSLFGSIFRSTRSRTHARTQLAMPLRTFIIIIVITIIHSDYDHLCPWTGTGIGRNNMWAFKSFVITINILCYFSIALVVWALLDGLAA